MASAVLGTLVGLVAVAAQGRARLALVAPFVASVLVSTLTLIAVKQGWVEGGPIQLMVPCLFFFIPGDAISAGLLELADGRITAGATRLIYSVAILLVLAFGALVGTVLADVPTQALFDVDVQDTLGFWAAWGGWVIFAVGTMLTFSMRPADFPWALGLILLTAAAAQLGTRAFDEVLGTFLGAVVMTATALTLARNPRRPPAYVMYLGAFYVLTRGSHGLRGFESWLGHHPIEGFKGLSDMLALMTALAVGMLVTAARASPAALRLDQVGAVSRLADQAEHGAIEPADGLRRLDHIGDLRHRFGAVGVVGGHAVLTVGLALILQPTPVALVTATVFGTLIGVLKLYAGHMATAQILMPVCAAILVSWLAFAVAPEKTTDASMRVLIPALVTFLPGSLLTTATLDLAAGEVISGSSRLVAGVMQLVLLSFGMVVGVELSGVPLDEAITNTAQNTLGDWAPWLGVIVFGLGAFVHFSGPPHALGWLLLVLLSAYVGQQLGGHLVSKDLSGFTGALLVTVVAAWVARRPTGPPQMATFLPAFWLLVPGAVGLIGMAEFVGTDREAGLDHFVHMIDTFIAIGLGVLVGNALVLRFTRGSSAPRAHARSARAER